MPDGLCSTLIHPHCLFSPFFLCGEGWFYSLLSFIPFCIPWAWQVRGLGQVVVHEVTRHVWRTFSSFPTTLCFEIFIFLLWVDLSSTVFSFLTLHDVLSNAFSWEPCWLGYSVYWSPGKKSDGFRTVCFFISFSHKFPKRFFLSRYLSWLSEQRNR